MVDLIIISYRKEKKQTKKQKKKQTNTHTHTKTYTPRINIPIYKNGGKSFSLIKNYDKEKHTICKLWVLMYF